MREDLLRSLRKERQGTDRHVAMFGRGDEVAHLAYFVEAESAWATTSAARTVIELAALLALDPGVVAAR